VHVILTARRVNLLKKIAAEIEAAGGRASVCRLDVQQANRAAKVIMTLDKKFGGIDLVLANAGVGIAKSPSWSWS
jgi:NADP-dependent 3-hydroxy acid dehydrogenase YdfG